MKSLEIKADLIRKGIALTDIADEAGCTVQQVSQCIRGDGLYHRIRAIIAKKLGKPVSTVFAKHHPQPKRTGTFCKAACLRKSLGHRRVPFQL